MPNIFEALSKGVKSGDLDLLIGVGTVTINTLYNFKSSGFVENFNPILPFLDKLVTSIISSRFDSKVWSFPANNSSTLFWLISNPKTLYFFANSIARGRPTYPSPMIAIEKIFLSIINSIYIMFRFEWSFSFNPNIMRLIFT